MLVFSAAFILFGFLLQSISSKIIFDCNVGWKFLKNLKVFQKLWEDVENYCRSLDWHFDLRYHFSVISMAHFFPSCSCCCSCWRTFIVSPTNFNFSFTNHYRNLLGCLLRQFTTNFYFSTSTLTFHIKLEETFYLPCVTAPWGTIVPSCLFKKFL